MLLNRYVQQPDERLKKLIDYTSWLETDEQIDTVTAAVEPVTDIPFEITNILIDDAGKKFAFYGEGGEAGEDYKVTFTVTTSIAQVRTDEIEYEIEEA